MEKQYIYIAKASNEKSRCKIGKTSNLEARLHTYNNVTGQSIDVVYEYLFTCEVSNMTQVENDIKKEFSIVREVLSKEVYLLRADLFEKYVNFIKEHPLFIEEIFIKKDDKPEVKVKFVAKIKPTLTEQGINPVDVLNKAKRIADDEFYTRYEDIEKEINMYDKSIWKDKCVFCNCDDAVDDDDRRTSAFALFFLNNFKELQLKKLICTHYSGGIDLFNAGSRGYIFTKEGFSEIKDDYDKMKKYPREYDGSFDHPLSIKILNEEADIVCTNPPFSKARKYWKLIIESEKQFLIISNITNVKNQPYISYIMDNKVRPGYTRID